MATQSPFLFFERFLRTANPSGWPALEMPHWLAAELRQRLILLLNHVLLQEPAACDRLKRLKGQIVLVKWHFIDIKFVATPAGLLDIAAAGIPPDLSLWLTQDSPLDLALTLFRGGKPGVRIEGDVQLAAEVNWLADHVKWDIEEDISRLIGDVPAHTLMQTMRQVADALRHFAEPKSESAARHGPESSVGLKADMSV